DEHIAHTVLQCLETAQRLTELLAHLQVVAGKPHCLFHYAYGLGAQSDHGVGMGLLEDLIALARFADHVIHRYFEVTELDFGAPAVVNQAVRSQLQPRACRVNKKQTDTLQVCPGTTSASGNDQFIGNIARDNGGFTTVEQPGGGASTLGTGCHMAEATPGANLLMCQYG